MNRDIFLIAVAMKLDGFSNLIEGIKKKDSNLSRKISLKTY